MTVLLAPIAINELLTYLRTNLNTKVTALASSFPHEPVSGNAVALRSVAAWHVGEQRPGSVKAPAIIVLAENTKGLNEGAWGFESQNGVVIYAIDTDANSEALRWKLYYWATAIFNCLRDTQYGAGMADTRVFWSEELVTYGRVETIGDRGLFWGDISLHVQLQQQELA